MNKMYLVEEVQREFGGTRVYAERIVDHVFESISKALATGEEVSITGFGLFFVKKRSARMGVNPRTGEKIQVEATVTPKFRAGKYLKALVKER